MDLTERDEAQHRVALRPRQSMPPIADSTIEPSGGITVEVEDLCDRAGIRYRVTGGSPPLVVLREGGGHVCGRLETGRECFVVNVSGLPTEEPERSMRVLELLVRGFGCYQAEKSLCSRGYFSPDIVTTYSGHVIIEGTDE